MEKNERTWLIITWVCLIIGFGLCAYLAREEIKKIFWFLCRKIHNADQHSIDADEERDALAPWPIIPHHVVLPLLWRERRGDEDYHHNEDSGFESS